jgi:hypothetical protein
MLALSTHHSIYVCAGRRVLLLLCSAWLSCAVADTRIAGAMDAGASAMQYPTFGMVSGDFG